MAPIIPSADSCGGKVRAKEPATRRARALIGWMAPAEARLALAGRKLELKDRPEYAERVQNARAAAALRKHPGSNPISEAPPLLKGHIRAMDEHPAIAQSFQQGWQVKLVDLNNVCPLQSYLMLNHPVFDRTASVHNDPLSLAELTTPVSGDTQIPFQFDAQKRAWILNSTDFNLRIMAEQQARLAPGIGTFGFVVGTAPPLLKIALHQGRYLIVDGTHRAYGLLRRGLCTVPCLFRAAPAWPGVESPTSLPVAALLGENPPLLSDFLSDETSAEIRVPVTRRVLVIQATEYTMVEPE